MGRRRKKKKQKSSATQPASRLLDLELRSVELARGYDGPLRGSPEPALLFGIYRVTLASATLLARRVLHLQPSGEYPERLELRGADLGVRIPYVEGMRVLVLAAALEEDDGRGVERLYADLESPAQLAAWTVDAAIPEPISLLEWARTAPLPAPATARVHLVDAAGDLRDRELGDDWIGAALFHLEDGDNRRSERRMRFVSEDGKNDWTAVLEARLA